jgi:(1->4)-alpha-D-glucan 1-alpha-D-glucosylmutase
VNRPLKRTADEEPVPAPNDEYLLYQTLVGAFPLGDVDADARREFVERMQRYMEKATREAKVRTSWINPQEEYDAALAEYVEAILQHEDFLADFLPFQRRVARAGMLNSLSQTLIKLTCPGVPDVYQGQEIWDLSLVDPDNRRQVDYGAREERLASLLAGAPGADAEEIFAHWEDGRPKLWVTHVALSNCSAVATIYPSRRRAIGRTTSLPSLGPTGTARRSPSRLGSGARWRGRREMRGRRCRARMRGAIPPSRSRAS